MTTTLPPKMAESQPNSTTHQPPVKEDAKKKLKYLDFVQAAYVYTIIWCSTVYEYAKQNSGPLRPGLHAVEGTVKTVIAPFYTKFHALPLNILTFIDRKVDESITGLNSHVPILFKQLSVQVCSAAEKAPEVAGELVSDIQHYGLLRTLSSHAKTAYARYNPVAKELYTKYEPVAEQYAVTTWRSLNRLPLFPQVAHIMVPTAAYWAEKYNNYVAFTASRGYAVSSYLPLVPIERIAKTFEGTERLPASSVNGGYVPISK